MTLALGLPALWQMILYGVAAIGGSFALYYFGKWAAGWLNEFDKTKNATSAGDGRSTADSSDQDLNSQTDKLPKD